MRQGKTEYADKVQAVVHRHAAYFLGDDELFD